ncbi:putative membrane protein [Terribacillus aidingensis]|uniref:Putative membrane protein n=1 Tax=Terribacillus aidingensis TaxID=586416 RepID=A0A285N082_9BACI|nr:YhgE/Pip domain-containing protein [Terribacillus aidingensis]SNZ02333.1 putative membrane protein [Terribacillus aidingensis]
MNMLKQEWRHIWKDRKMLLAICGILVVPLLYSVIFLAANWDPYNNTDQLPVAVVNLDKGSTFEGKELHVGSDFVDNLQENDKFNWQFVEEKQAMDGLKTEDYYMVVKIPENFSANAATLLDDNPKQMDIKYYSNPGKNYPASKITDSAIQQLEREVAEQVTEEYAHSVFTSLADVADGLKQASDGSKELADGSSELNEGAKNLNKNLASLSTSTATYTEKVGEADQGMQELNQGIGSLTSQYPEVDDGITELNKGLQTLNGKSGDLTSGSDQLVTGTNELTSGLDKLQQATGQLAGKFPELNNGIAAANEKVQTAGEAIKTSLDELTEFAQQLQTAQEEQTAQLNQLQATLTNDDLSAEEKQQQLQDQVQELADRTSVPEVQLPDVDPEAMQQELKGINKQLGQIQKLADGAEQTQTALTGIDEAAGKLYNGAAKIQSGQSELNSGIGAYTDGVSQAANGAPALVSGSQAVRDALGQLQSGSSKITNGLDQLNTNGPQLAEGASKLTDGSKTLSDGTQSVTDGSSELYDQLAKGASDANISTSDKTETMFASPTDVQEEKLSTVHSYGEGLAPYILSIGLFVGALVFTNIFPLRDPAGRPTSGFSWFLSKFSIVCFVSILQSLFAVIMLVHVVHLQVHSEWRLLVFAILFSLTSFLLIQLLTVALDNVGRFLGIIVLLVQIGAGAGTYPVALLPEFFQVIHKFVPMTYAISGFREIISIGDDWGFLWQQAGYLSIFSVLFLALTILVYSVQTRKYKKETEEDTAVSM